MTNITREQIEYCIKTNSSTEDEHRQICDLALRAFDTPSVEIEARAYERAACAAEGPLLEINDNTGEARYRGTENVNWLVPQLIAGHYGSDYGTGRYDAAKAIRALSPATTRYVELPEGHVVVPLGELQEIANQHLCSELTFEAQEHADFEGGYDIIVSKIRAMIGKVK